MAAPPPPVKLDPCPCRSPSPCASLYSPGHSPGHPSPPPPAVVPQAPLPPLHACSARHCRDVSFAHSRALPSYAAVSLWPITLLLPRAAAAPNTPYPKPVPSPSPAPVLIHAQAGGGEGGTPSCAPFEEGVLHSWAGGEGVGCPFMGMGLKGAGSTQQQPGGQPALGQSAPVMY